MLVQLTHAGVVKLNSGELTLASYQLAAGFNYTPSPDAIALVGAIVHSGIPSLPAEDTANLLRYSVSLDYGTGPFSYGEVGLFAEDGTLVALCVSDTLIHKDVPTTTDMGESQRIDLYIAVTETGYNAWVAMAESSNSFQLAILETVDLLPPALSAVPNAYLVSPVSSSQSAYLAFTDREGLWAFDAYGSISTSDIMISARSRSSITIPRNLWDSHYYPDYDGKTILQFCSGSLIGTCRYVDTATVSADGQSMVLGIKTKFAALPMIGDQIKVLSRSALATSNVVLPIATTHDLGAVRIGSTLTISANGTLDMDPLASPVQSVAGRQGQVMLTVDDIAELAKVAKTGDYLDLLNIPDPLTKASATALGGVRLPTSGDFAITVDGDLSLSFVPVKTVNGQAPDASGAVTIPVSYATQHEMAGAYSLVSEFQLVVETPQRQAYDVTSFALSAGRSSDLFIQVLQEGDSVEVQASKVAIAISADKLMVSEYAIQTSAGRFPISARMASSGIIVSVDARELTVQTADVHNNVAVDMEPLGIPNAPTTWNYVKRQDTDPLFLFATQDGGVRGLKALANASAWLYKPTVAAMDWAIVTGAYGNGIYLGMSALGFATSVEGDVWTKVTSSNAIYTWMQASGHTMDPTTDALLFDSDRNMFLFAARQNGLTYESSLGDAWTLSARQLPLPTTNIASLQHVKGHGFYQLSNEGKLQKLNGNTWETVYDFVAHSFSYSSLLSSWLVVYNDGGPGDGGNGLHRGKLLTNQFVELDDVLLAPSGTLWTTLPSGSSLGGNIVLRVVSMPPRSTVDGEAGAFWIMAENSVMLNYVSVIVAAGTNKLTISGTRTSLK